MGGYIVPSEPASGSGALAARPSATSVQLGSTYFDTTTGVDWECKLIGGTPTWWSPAKASVTVTAGGSGFTGTGGTTYDSWVQTGVVFAASEQLVGFTHSAGVLTYTGPGELVAVTVTAAIAHAATATVTIGVSVNNADPAAANQALVSVQTSYFRGVAIRTLVKLATNDTLRVKMLTSVSNTIQLAAGTCLAVG